MNRLVLLCLGFWVLQDAAAEMIEQVVVTAQKREEGLQEVPLAVSAYTDTFIEDRQINNLGELAKYPPSFRLDEGGTLRNSFVAARIAFWQCNLPRRSSTQLRGRPQAAP